MWLTVTDYYSGTDECETVGRERKMDKEMERALKQKLEGNGDALCRDIGE